MESLGVCTHLWVKRNRKRSYEVVLHKKRAVTQNRKLFARKQAKQRLVLAFVMSMTAISLHHGLKSTGELNRKRAWAARQSGLRRK